MDGYHGPIKRVLADMGVAVDQDRLRSACVDAQAGSRGMPALVLKAGYSVGARLKRPNAHVNALSP